MSNNQNIYLIGFMGSGKSTVGRLLATAKKRQFIDLDHYIETNQKMSISDLFESVGEPGFRKIESEALQSLSHQSDLIIATGGGTPCNTQNRKILQTGTVIYLQCNLKTLTDRLYTSRSTRPLLYDCDTKAKLYNFIRSTLIKRKTCYEKFDIKVKNNDSSNELINSLLQLI